METSWKSVLIVLLATPALAILFTLLAIYDSDKMSFGVRFAFWLTTIGSGMATALVILPWLSKSPLSNMAIPYRLCILAAIASLPVPIVLLGFDTGFRTGWPITNWLQQYLMVFVLAVIILTGIYPALKAFGGANTEQVSVPDSDALSFRKRLPVALSHARLIAVSAEDHYLRVHTDLGEALILMRLSDALEALADVDGMQTHRSWWVATDGVDRIITEGGRKSLALKSGISVPIARSRLKRVRESLPR